MNYTYHFTIANSKIAVKQSFLCHNDDHFTNDCFTTISLLAKCNLQHSTIILHFSWKIIIKLWLIFLLNNNITFAATTVGIEELGESVILSVTELEE